MSDATVYTYIYLILCYKFQISRSKQVFDKNIIFRFLNHSVFRFWEYHFQILIIS